VGKRTRDAVVHDNMVGSVGRVIIATGGGGGGDKRPNSFCAVGREKKGSKWSVIDDHAKAGSTVGSTTPSRGKKKEEENIFIASLR